MHMSITAPYVTRSDPHVPPRQLSRSRICSRLTGSAILLALSILLLCTIPRISALTFNNTYRIGTSSEKWTATCIASGSPTDDAAMIGGYVTHALNGTTDFKVIKSDVKSGDVLWTQTIRPQSVNTKNMVLGCASDSSGNLYVATASTANTFDGVQSSLSLIWDAHGLFLSKLKGGDGSFIWTQSLGRSSSGANDLLDVAWDPAANHVVVFGQMYAGAGSAIKEARLMRFGASCGVLLEGQSFVVGLESVTTASGLAVDANGYVYVATVSTEAVNNEARNSACSGINCQSCFVSKYGADSIHQWTRMTSLWYYCNEAVLAVDRVTNNVFTYMDVGPNRRDHLGLLRQISVDGILGQQKVIGDSGSTWAGAVFVHGGTILASGVTSENLGFNWAVTSTFNSFIARITWDSLVTINDIEYLARVSNADAMESRRSGIVWSAFSSQAFVLTAQRYFTYLVSIDAPTWLAIDSPLYILPSTIRPLSIYSAQTCPTVGVTTTLSSTTTYQSSSTTAKTSSSSSSTSGTVTSFSSSATKSSSTDPTISPTGNAGGPGDKQDSPLDSPFFWVAMGLLLSIGIASTIALLYIRRQRSKRNSSPDKENQFKLDPRGSIKSTRGLLQSSSVLATSPLYSDVSQSSLQINSRRASRVPSTGVVANSARPMTYTLSMNSVAELAPPAPAKSMKGSTPSIAGRISIPNGRRTSKTARSNFQDILVDQETIVVANTPATTSTASQDAIGWTRAFGSGIRTDPPKTAPKPILKGPKPTPLNLPGASGSMSKGVFVDNCHHTSQTIADTVTRMTLGDTKTIMSPQKAMAIPGFLEMQDGVDFTVGKELARGGGGAVYLGEASNPEILRISKSKQIVVKRVFENEDDPEESVAAFDQEVAIMWLLSERNIAKIVGFCRKPMSILMKFYPLGSLDGLIHSQSKKPLLSSIVYNDDLALHLATDIACGVMIIHQEGLFHSDLKPPNVLLDIDEQGELYAVITDFGVTQVVKQSALLVKAFRVSTTAGASPCYAAPEILDYNSPASRSAVVQQAADTFSFAVILAELITRDVPWRFATRIEDVTDGVVAGQRAYRRPLNFGPHDYHARVAIMVERCWDQSPRARPQMETVYHELKAMLGNSQRQ